MGDQVEDVVVEVEDVVVVVEADDDVIIRIIGDNNTTNIVLFSPDASITTASGERITNGVIESDGETGRIS